MKATHVGRNEDAKKKSNWIIFAESKNKKSIETITLTLIQRFLRMAYHVFEGFCSKVVWKKLAMAISLPFAHLRQKKYSNKCTTDEYQTASFQVNYVPTFEFGSEFDGQVCIFKCSCKCKCINTKKYLISTHGASDFEQIH